MIDVLLATFNSEKYVAQQIDSIIAQDHKGLKLIIRDDRSSDNTFAILQDKAKQYPDHILLISDRTNLGIIGNFSELMRHSKGDYILFSDHDDFWLPMKVSQTLQKMELMEQKFGKNMPLLVHTDLSVANEQLEVKAPSFWKYSKINPKKGMTLNRILSQNSITGCTMMINRSLLDICHPIPNEAMMHDWWIALVAASFGKIGIVPTSTILYRQHGNNSLGAKKSGTISELQDFLSSRQEYSSRAASLFKKQQRQAFSFLEIYRLLLTKDQKQLLRDFARLPDQSFFQKWLSILKNGFFKQGLLRNLRDILLR